MMLIRQRDEDVLRRHRKEFGQTVQEIKEIRRALEEQAGKLVSKCESLRSTVRRNHSDLTQGYLVFVNGHIRLAGAFQQALKRAVPMDRILDRTHQEVDDEKARRQMEQDRDRLRAERASRRRVRQAVTPTDRDIEDLFGLEDEDGG